MTQLKDGDRITETVDLDMPRGDTREHPFTHELGPSSAVKEARFFIRTNDSAETVLVSLSLDSHSSQFDFSTDYECTLRILPDDTEGVTIGTHKFGLELVDQSDDVYTPWTGSFALTDDVVHDDESAPHLSWDTREDLDAEIDTYEAYVLGMATTADVTWITSAASSGASSIVVANAAFLADTDTVRVMQDDGTYLATTLDGNPSGNTVSLDDTLTDDAAVGSIVRLVV